MKKPRSSNDPPENGKPNPLADVIAWIGLCCFVVGLVSLVWFLSKLLIAAIGVLIVLIVIAGAFFFAFGKRRD